MKLTKADLKDIVKECLVEILGEGLGATASTQPQTTPKMKRPSTSSVFVEKTNSRPEPRRAIPQLHEVVKREAGGNKIMEMILADTAASTLPKMLEGDRRGSSGPVSGGVAEQVVAAAEPEDLFGEDVASKWANLAFMDSSPKK